jgi:hypothetical protein
MKYSTPLTAATTISTPTAAATDPVPQCHGASRST